MTDISNRLFRQLHKARGRNLRATLKDIDAAGIRDLPVNAPLADAGTVDRFVRQHIEGAICWRDPRSVSGQLQERVKGC